MTAAARIQHLADRLERELHDNDAVRRFVRTTLLDEAPATADEVLASLPGDDSSSRVTFAGSTATVLTARGLDRAFEVALDARRLAVKSDTGTAKSLPRTPSRRWIAVLASAIAVFGGMAWWLLPRRVRIEVQLPDGVPATALEVTCPALETRWDVTELVVTVPRRTELGGVACTGTLGLPPGWYATDPGPEGWFSPSKVSFGLERDALQHRPSPDQGVLVVSVRNGTLGDRLAGTPFADPLLDGQTVAWLVAARLPGWISDSVPFSVGATNELRLPDRSEPPSSAPKAPPAAPPRAPAFATAGASHTSAPLVKPAAPKLRVQVIDYTTKTAVEGVAVSFESKRVTTDADGWFTLPTLDEGAGEYPLGCTFDKVGYLTENKTVQYTLTAVSAGYSPIEIVRATGRFVVNDFTIVQCDDTSTTQDGVNDDCVFRLDFSVDGVKKACLLPNSRRGPVTAKCGPFEARTVLDVRGEELDGPPHGDDGIFNDDDPLTCTGLPAELPRAETVVTCTQDESGTPPNSLTFTVVPQ